MLKNINDREAGKYRSCNVLISGAKHKPPESYLISQEMEKLINLYQSEWSEETAVIRASRLHIFLVKIHPFIYGNGRTSRLLMNLELLKNNYPAIAIKNAQRVQYYLALDEAHCRENYDLFDNIVADCILDEYERQMYLLN